MATTEVLVELSSRLAILVISVLIILLAARRAVQQEKDTLSLKEDSTHQTLTWYHVIAFPIAGSVVLLVMFYLFDYIQFIFTILIIIVSLGALFSFLYPFVKQCMILMSQKSIPHKQPETSFKFCSDILICGLLSVLLVVLWVSSGYWLLLDILGIAISVFMLEFIRVPNLKLSSFLLTGLLVYDIFWVFCSSSLFDANVMVQVATKKAKNPVAVVAESLNFPEVAKSRPPLSLPGKLIVPSSLSEDHYAILGLGDIVLPGLILCLAMRFDHFGKTSGVVAGGGTTNACWIFCKKQTYFCVTLLGYAIGLIVASVMVDVTHLAQPALLYLVPGVLIPLVIKAFLQRDLGVLWNSPFLEQTPLPL